MYIACITVRMYMYVRLYVQILKAHNFRLANLVTGSKIIINMRLKFLHNSFKLGFKAKSLNLGVRSSF